MANSSPTWKRSWKPTKKPTIRPHPVLCMDEQPVQLLKETREPIPATEDHPQRVDYEYERAGTASIFMFAEPLSGFRQATARPQRTKVDWAVEVAALLDTRYADCDRVTLVCDNLNTHTMGAFYEAFEPELRPPVRPSHRILLHAETRELVERCRMRTQLPDEPMLTRPPDRRLGIPANRNPHLVGENEREAAWRRLAIQDRRRPPKTQTAVPQN